MSDEPKELHFDDLGLKKPLDKMTAKELRALIVEKIPMITGASGMDKDQLVTAIREVFGMSDEEGAANPYKDQISSIKREIRTLRGNKAETNVRAERDALRKKINKLKKRTRRLANAV